MNDLVEAIHSFHTDVDNFFSGYVDVFDWCVWLQLLTVFKLEFKLVANLYDSLFISISDVSYSIE